MASQLISVEISGPGGSHDRTITVSRDLSKPAPTEKLDDSPYSFEYTGKHDHGALPPQGEGTSYGHLLDAILEAKAVSDAHLREMLTANSGTVTKVRES